MCILCHYPILVPLSINASTSDAIPPHAVAFSFNEILDDSRALLLWAYNIDTVLAEKVETILHQTVFNAHPKDFYDSYIMTTTQKNDSAVFKQALQVTATHQGATEQITDVVGIIQDISKSNALCAMWYKYHKQFAYATDILFVQIIEILHKICQQF